MAINNPPQVSFYTSKRCWLKISIFSHCGGETKNSGVPGRKRFSLFGDCFCLVVCVSDQCLSIFPQSAVNLLPNNRQCLQVKCWWTPIIPREEEKLWQQQYSSKTEEGKINIRSLLERVLLCFAFCKSKLTILPPSNQSNRYIYNFVTSLSFTYNTIAWTRQGKQAALVYRARERLPCLSQFSSYLRLQHLLLVLLEKGDMNQLENMNVFSEP